MQFPDTIIIVFYTLHTRCLLQSGLRVFTRDVMALLILKFLGRASPCRESGGKDRSGSYRAHGWTPVQCVRSGILKRQAGEVPCFLVHGCTLFPEKQDLQLKRNGNTSGSDISADAKINLFWGVEETQEKTLEKTLEILLPEPPALDS